MSKKLKIKLLILVMLLVVAIFLTLLLHDLKNQKLTVAFLDIGQGDSIFIEAPNGNQVLIDGGVGRAVLRELGSVLPFYDRKIDVIIATHPDADHIGGLLPVLERYRADVFLEPGVEAETNVHDGLKAEVSRLESENKLKVIEARRGMVVDLGNGARLEILFPVYDPSFLETNTASIVARLVYGENEFLLTGDSPKEIESYLVLEDEASRIDLDSDVLKAGHHGSRTSTSEEFIKNVDPDYVVISAGSDNRYGHPHQEVLDIIESTGAKTLRTDQGGRVVFESDGVNLRVK